MVLIEENKESHTRQEKEKTHQDEEYAILRTISPTSYYPLGRRALYRKEVYQAHVKDAGGGIKWLS
jgi:hypothetical protein